MVAMRWRVSAAVVTLWVAAQAVWGAVGNAEDLTGCRLPNGMVVMPAPGTSGAAQGTLLRFPQLTFTELKAQGQPVATLAERVDRVRDARLADLQYVPDKDPNRDGILAFSGCISALGVSDLADHSGRQLRAPLEIRRTAFNPGGLCWGVDEGHVFLMQTVGQRYVLLRVLEKTPAALVIQFVYQPDGTLSFEIPRNAPIAYQRLGDAAGNAAAAASAASPDTELVPLTAVPAPATLTPGPIPATAATGRDEGVRLTPQTLGPGDINESGVIRIVSGSPQGQGPASAMDTYLQQRSQLIESRMRVVGAVARTDVEVEQKARAMEELGLLRAEDATELLVSQVAFLNPRTQAREFSVDAFHPAVQALKQLGKPASRAALKGLRELNLEGPGEGTGSPHYRAELLGQVIRAVEGPDVAVYLLKRERDSSPQGRAALDYVLGKLQP